MGRLKTAESEFVAQVQIIVDNMNAGIIGQASIPEASWEAAETEFAGLKTAITAANNARAFAKSATTGKNIALKNTRGDMQEVVDRLYATPSITDEQLDALGLPPRSAGSLPAPPQPVLDLVAAPSSNGSCTLKFKRNGNSRSTMFEVQATTDSAWTVIGTTLATKFVDPNATPGVAKSYRVVSKNVRGSSNPSNTASIYVEADDSGLKLAA